MDVLVQGMSLTNDQVLMLLGKNAVEREVLTLKANRLMVENKELKEELRVLKQLDPVEEKPAT